jgi:hypothetical protein
MRDFDKVKSALNHDGNRLHHVKPLRKLIDNFVNLYPIWKYTEYYRELTNMLFDLESRLIDEKFNDKTK